MGRSVVSQHDVDIGAKVHVKYRAIHHKRWDGLDSGSVALLSTVACSFETNAFYDVFRRIESAGNNVLCRDTD
ncbi:MAG TPA: hypothetical protein VIW47_13450 [Nitrospiraceae bacterium]